MPHIPFPTIDWGAVEKVNYSGKTGTATWQTLQYPGLRIRLVTYSVNHVADNWCQKGHIVHCLKGSFVSELGNENAVILDEGMSYIVFR